jgi:hypothetical protein
MITVTIEREFEETVSFTLDNEDWATKLLNACKDIDASMRHKLAVIAGIKLEDWNKIGGTETIYYDIKGAIDKYCYATLAEMDA